MAAVRGLALAPMVVLLGGLLGYAKVMGISQSRFDLAVLVASALAGSALLLVQEHERGAQMAAYSTT